MQSLDIPHADSLTLACLGNISYPFFLCLSDLNVMTMNVHLFLSVYSDYIHFYPTELDLMFVPLWVGKKHQQKVWAFRTGGE